MLTDSEKRWLQLRKLYAGVNRQSYYSCMHCQLYDVGRWSEYIYPCNNALLYGGCPNIDIRSSGAISDYVEAVEFEARVTALLADAYWPPLVYTPVAPFEQLFMPPADRLKWARLKVEEEEMDGQS